MKALYSLMLVLSLSLIGCGGGQKSIQSTDEGEIPEWYLNPPQDPNYIFGKATAASKDMQMAVDKGEMDARNQIGRTIETKLEGLQKKFNEEVGSGPNSTYLEQMTQASKTIVSQSLSGSKIIKNKISKDGGNFRAYVLVQYPVGAAAEAFQQQIKKNDEMYTRFRASQSFKELDEEVKKYEEWKKQQSK